MCVCVCWYASTDSTTCLLYCSPRPAAIWYQEGELILSTSVPPTSPPPPLPAHGSSHASHLHIHTLSLQFNFTHNILRLSFGDDYPGQVNPLDSHAEVATEDLATGTFTFTRDYKTTGVLWGWFYQFPWFPFYSNSSPWFLFCSNSSHGLCLVLTVLPCLCLVLTVPPGLCLVLTVPPGLCLILTIPMVSVWF